MKSHENRHVIMYFIEVMSNATGYYGRLVIWTRLKFKNQNDGKMKDIVNGKLCWNKDHHTANKKKYNFKQQSYTCWMVPQWLKFLRNSFIQNANNSFVNSRHDWIFT